MSVKNSLKILIVAGGTGGHIYPALAVGEALARDYPQHQVRFLCGERELELRIYGDAGVSPIVFPARQIKPGILGKAGTGAAVVANVWKAVKLIRREDFDVVLGMGGYVSGPALLAAILLRRRTAIHEANSVPGKTNSWLSRFVSTCAVHFEITGRLLRSRNPVRVGMPVRAGVFEGTRDEGIAKYGLDASRRTVLITGGSQGAKFLYRTIADALPALDLPEHGDVQVLWSTGTSNYQEILDKVTSHTWKHMRVHVHDFLQMPLALAVADAAVARAGASTIAEFVSLGIRALYIPLPTAIYDHQRVNAEQTSTAGMGSFVLESDFTRERAISEIRTLIDATRQGERLAVPANLDSRKAADSLARLLIGITSEGA